MGFDEGVIDIHGFDADGQPAAARHGVAGVDGQVHDHLLDHAAVAMNEGILRGRLKFERDGFAEEPLQHLGHVADDVLQIERLGVA